MRDDCRTIGHHFLEYVYRELDEALRLRVDRHLQDCRRCREDLDGLRETLVLIDESTLEPEEDLSDNFSSIVMAIIQRRAADRRNPAVQLLLAACLALVVGVGLLHGPAGRREAAAAGVPQREIQLLAEELGDPLLGEIARRNGVWSGGVSAFEVLIWARES